MRCPTAASRSPFARSASRSALEIEWISEPGFGGAGCAVGTFTSGPGRLGPWVPRIQIDRWLSRSPPGWRRNRDTASCDWPGLDRRLRLSLDRHWRTPVPDRRALASAGEARGMTTTQTIWITRQVTTVRHIRGLLEGLEAAGALDFAEVKIMAVDDERGVVVPREAVASIADGDVELAGDVLVTADNLPPEGILWVAEERG